MCSGLEDEKTADADCDLETPLGSDGLETLSPFRVADCLKSKVLD
jgi:hypothetical protein